MADQTIEIDAEVTQAISKQVTDSMQEKFDAQAKEFESKLAELSKVEETSVDKGARGGQEAEVVSGLDALTKEQFAVEQVKAALGNHARLQELNQHALKSLEKAGVVNKATYLNVGTDADGGVLVPNNELLSDIMDLLPEYSAMAGEIRVITLTNGEGIDVSTLTADVIMTEVGTEGGTKDDTKPTFGDKTVNVREFAGIAIMTKKLLKQSAFDVYAILRDSFARAIAKNREVLALTDATSGIVNDAGVVETYAGGSSTSGSTSVADVTWEEIKAMPFAVPTQSANGGIYAISRVLLAALDGLTDSQGREIVTMDQGGAGSLSGRFKNGYRFVVAESLGAADAVDTAFCVFGNFGQYAIDVRQGAVESDVFDSGVVDDGVTEHNLINENKLAMRVETWENVGYPLPGAFNVLKTAAS